MNEETRQRTAVTLRRQGAPKEAQTDRLAAKASPTNRPVIEKGVQWRPKKGLKAPSTYNWAYAMCKLDSFVEPCARIVETAFASNGIWLANADGRRRLYSYPDAEP